MDRDGAKPALLLFHPPTMPFNTGEAWSALAHRFYARPPLSAAKAPTLIIAPSALSFSLPYQWTLSLARPPNIVLFLFARHPCSGLHRPFLKEHLVTPAYFYPDSPPTPSLLLLSYNETPSL
jgi:hypothetical protein